MAEQSSIDTFHIVFMCTGNQARSVIAEHYTRKITAGMPVSVESVGLLDTRGAPALPEAIRAAGALSLDLAEHVSRPFSAIDLAAADLVLGFEQQHVATAVVDGNAGFDRTFKLLELVRLLDQAGGNRADVVEAARDTIARAATARQGDNAFRPGEDLADPAGRNDRFFEETADAIRSACDELVRKLFTPPGGSGASIWD